MAGSGKKPGKEALKNKAMLVLRNITKQEVTNVIFPNGLTVGTIDLKNGAKVHGNVQVTGVLNASDVRIDGLPITGSMGLTAFVNVSPSNVIFPADYNGNIDTGDLSLGDTTIGAVLGSETLQVDNSTPFDSSTFRVGSPSASGITLGAETQSDGSTSVTYTTHNTMTGDTATITYPIILNVSGTESTVNVQQNFIKSKAPVPTPFVFLTRDLISIPTDFLGRNPSDNQYFAASTDFPDYAKTTLSVEAGNTSVTWYGDQNSATPSNPPEGNFLIDWRSVTGTTENGTALTFKSAGTFSATGQDKDYFIYIGNSSSGYVAWLRITEDSSGNPDIDMSKLTEFDDNGLNSYTDGSQRFDVIDLTIPVKVTLGGVTSTVNKSLTISKQKAAQPTPLASLSNDTITIPANSLGQNPVDNSYWASSSDFVDAQSTDLTVTAGSTSLTWSGDQNSASPADPTEGNFLINWHSATGASDTGATLQYVGHTSWSGSGDKAYSAFIGNASGGYVVTFSITENSAGNPNIRMKFLNEFDDASPGAWSGGATRFDELYINIPVKVTLGGTTTTITKTLTVSKQKSGTDGDPGTPALNDIQVTVSPPFIGFSEDSSAVVTPTLNGSNARYTVTVTETDLAGNSTSLTNTSTSPPTAGFFRIGATSNGTFTSNNSSLGTSDIIANNGGFGYLQVASLPSGFTAGALTSLPIQITDAAGNTRNREISVSLTKTTDGAAASASDPDEVTYVIYKPADADESIQCCMRSVSGFTKTPTSVGQDQFFFGSKNKDEPDASKVQGRSQSSTSHTITAVDGTQKGPNEFYALGDEPSWINHSNESFTLAQGTVVEIDFDAHLLFQTRKFYNSYGIAHIGSTSVSETRPETSSTADGFNFLAVPFISIGSTTRYGATYYMRAAGGGKTTGETFAHSTQMYRQTQKRIQCSIPSGNSVGSGNSSNNTNQHFQIRDADHYKAGFGTDLLSDGVTTAFTNSSSGVGSFLTILAVKTGVSNNPAAVADFGTTDSANRGPIYAGGMTKAVTIRFGLQHGATFSTAGATAHGTEKEFVRFTSRAETAAAIGLDAEFRRGAPGSSYTAAHIFNDNNNTAPGGGTGHTTTVYEGGTSSGDDPYPDSFADFEVLERQGSEEMPPQPYAVRVTFRKVN